MKEDRRNRLSECAPLKEKRKRKKKTDRKAGGWHVRVEQSNEGGLLMGSPEARDNERKQ
jgi:hypothetical protein